MEYYPYYVDQATGSVQKMIVFGGGSGEDDASPDAAGDTWTLSYDAGTQKYTWNNITASSNCGSGYPPARSGGTLAWDGKELVLFGGIDQQPFEDTWFLIRETSGNLCWQPQTFATHPSARSKHRMAYNAATGEIVLFGGESGTLKNDTWFFKAPPGAGTGWIQCGSDAAHPCDATLPAPRCCVGLAYGDNGAYTVMFGGRIGGPSSPEWVNDTWTWDNTAGWVCRSSPTVCRNAS